MPAVCADLVAQTELDQMAAERILITGIQAVELNRLSGGGHNRGANEKVAGNGVAQRAAAVRAEITSIRHWIKGQLAVVMAAAILSGARIEAVIVGLEINSATPDDIGGI